MVIIVRGLEKGENDLPCWACPSCQLEQRHFQGFKTLHKHLYEMHAERLVHMTSIAYLAAFWAGSRVSHMCLRVMDWLELHLEPDQSLNNFKSLCPPRPSWWPANDPEYFNEELTLDPWVTTCKPHTPMDNERAELGPLPAIDESFEKLPEAMMARSHSETSLTSRRPARQSIDNSHPAIMGRQPVASMQQLLGRLDPDRQNRVSVPLARRSLPASLRKPPRHPNSPEKARPPAVHHEPAWRVSAVREPVPQEVPGVELPASMEELGLLDPYQQEPVLPASSQVMQLPYQAQGHQTAAQPSTAMQTSDLPQDIANSRGAMGVCPSAMTRNRHPADSPVSTHMVGSQANQPLHPLQALVQRMDPAQSAKGFRGMQRSHSIQQGLFSVGEAAQAELPTLFSQGHVRQDQIQDLDLTAHEVLQESPSLQRSYRDVLSRDPARSVQASSSGQPGFDQSMGPGDPSARAPASHLPAASSETWHTAMPAFPDRQESTAQGRSKGIVSRGQPTRRPPRAQASRRHAPAASPSATCNEPIDLEAEPALAAVTGVEHSYTNLGAAEMYRPLLKSSYAEVIKSVDRAALGIVLSVLLNFGAPYASSCLLLCHILESIV